MFDIIKKVYGYFVVIPLIILVCIPKEYTCTNINKYRKYYGDDGEIKEYYSWRNDIFPNKIVDKTNVKEFIVKKYSTIDDLYVGYLVMHYDVYDYSQEKNRLLSLKSDEIYSIYGLNGFKKELCALNSNNYGLIYALADDSSLEISYVSIQFTDYVCDIDYTKIIDKEDLPIGFNALPDNDVQKAFFND